MYVGCAARSVVNMSILRDNSTDVDPSLCGVNLVEKQQKEEPISGKVRKKPRIISACQTYYLVSAKIDRGAETHVLRTKHSCSCRICHVYATYV